MLGSLQRRKGLKSATPECGG